MFPPTPGPVTLERGWPGPCSIRMRHWRMISKVHCIMRWDDDGHQSSAEGRLEYSRGSPAQWTEYQIDIGKEKKMLETVDPTWRATCWLQLAVQGISDDEVPWYKLITLLMVGAEGVALSLAKHLLAIWQWRIRSRGRMFARLL